MTQVLTLLKNCADAIKAGYPSDGNRKKIKANGRCCTVVSVIADCWHIKFRNVKCVYFGEN